MSIPRGGWCSGICGAFDFSEEFLVKIPTLGLEKVVKSDQISPPWKVLGFNNNQKFQLYWQVKQILKASITTNRVLLSKSIYSELCREVKSDCTCIYWKRAYLQRLTDNSKDHFNMRLGFSPPQKKIKHPHPGAQTLSQIPECGYSKRVQMPHICPNTPTPSGLTLIGVLCFVGNYNPRHI